MVTGPGTITLTVAVSVMVSMALMVTGVKSLAQAFNSKSSNKLFSSPTVRNLSNFLNHALSLLFYHSCMFGSYWFPSPSPPLSFPLPLSCLLTVILFQNATHMVFYSIVNKQAIVSIRVLRENFWLKNLKIKHAMRRYDNK